MSGRTGVQGLNARNRTQTVVLDRNRACPLPFPGNRTVSPVNRCIPQQTKGKTT